MAFNRRITISLADIPSPMSTPPTERTSLEEHLEQALDATESPESRYHIRESLQLLKIE